MKLQDQINSCRSMLECKVKVTKQLYKYFDSYQRRQRWVLKQLLKFCEPIKKGEKDAD